MKMPHLFAMLLATLVAAGYSERAFGDTFGSGTNTFVIDFVGIGNPGNIADVTGNPNPAGKVHYRFRMGKFEISEQMVENANALGGLGITLFTRGPDKPATSVSWNEAARFVNWLNTSTGRTPAYKFARQPGEVGYNENSDILLWDPSDPGYDPNNLYRNRLAPYVLPSVHEWYKAAYYDPTSGAYFDFPTGSNSAPTPVASGTAPGTAVYDGQAGPAVITLAGGLSPYGTMGQGGNAYEWEETEFDLVNGPASISHFVRAGWWLSPSANLRATFRNGGGQPWFESADIGFRVSSIPEPSSLFLGAMSSAGFLLRWRPRANHPRTA
jgi:formylglycine-generating enzyme